MTLKEELEHILYLVSEARKGNDCTANLLQWQKDRVDGKVGKTKPLDTRDETDSTRADLDRAMKRLVAVLNCPAIREDCGNALVE